MRVTVSARVPSVSFAGAAIRALDVVELAQRNLAAAMAPANRTDETHKAHLTSLYAIWLSCGYVVGPILAKAIAAVASDRSTPEAARVDAAARETLVSAYVVVGRPDRARAFFASIPGGPGPLVAAVAGTFDERGDVNAAALVLESSLDAGRDDAVCAAAARLLAAHGTSAPGSAAASSLPRLDARRRAVCGP